MSPRRSKGLRARANVSEPGPMSSSIFETLESEPARSRLEANAETSKPVPACSRLRDIEAGDVGNGAGSERARSWLRAGSEVLKPEPSRSRLGDIGAGVGSETARRHPSRCRLGAG